MKVSTFLFSPGFYFMPESFQKESRRQSEVRVMSFNYTAAFLFVQFSPHSRKYYHGFQYLNVFVKFSFGD